MANEEVLHRDFVKRYREYTTDERRFCERHPDIEPGDLRCLEQLRANNVPTDYIERYGELKAEVMGELYDFQLVLSQFSTLDLAELKHGLNLAVEMGLLLMPQQLDQIGIPEYSRTSNELNLQLRFFSDMKKLQMVEAELDGRSQGRR